MVKAGVIIREAGEKLLNGHWLRHGVSLHTFNIGYTCTYIKPI
jgi:hypothetical protein